MKIDLPKASAIRHDSFSVRFSRFFKRDIIPLVAVRRWGLFVFKIFLPLALIMLPVCIYSNLYSHKKILWLSYADRDRNGSLRYLSDGSNSTFDIRVIQRNKPLCSKFIYIGPAKLVINTTLPTDVELNRLFPHIQLGGHWQPDHCQPRQRLGIFIPLRKRWHQLPILLRHLHQLLVLQWRHYTIFVVEQADDRPFNRGKLFNIGVTEALKLEPDLDCFILHDVDTLPETNLTIYKCHEDRRLVLQMATYQKKRNYETAYKGYTGGVLAIRRFQFEDINGFSNEFWGWGGEDDDLYNRLSNKSYQVVRDFSRSGYFYSLDHSPEPANEQREEILRKRKSNLHGEGLDSLRYDLLKNERRRLFTIFSVSSWPAAITLP